MTSCDGEIYPGASFTLSFQNDTVSHGLCCYVFPQETLTELGSNVGSLARTPFDRDHETNPASAALLLPAPLTICLCT